MHVQNLRCAKYHNPLERKNFRKFSSIEQGDHRCSKVSSSKACGESCNECLMKDH